MGKIKNRCRLPDIRLAVEMYYSKVELTNDDVQKLFGVGPSGAVRIKKPALELMAERKVRCWLPFAVNTKIAYEAWRINIEEYEQRLAKLRKLGLTGKEVTA